MPEPAEAMVEKERIDTVATIIQRNAPWRTVFSRSRAEEIAAEILAAVSPGCRGAELAEALAEARPYVSNRTYGDDWRAETAREVLQRVDEALAAFRASGEAGPDA
jgi:hypothetical protein